MHIQSLRIENFRNLECVNIKPHARLNFFLGANGAGKTSLLEALVVVSRGKSFKTNRAEELSGGSAGSFSIFLEAVHSARTHKLGLERSGGQWKARMDGQDLPLLSVLTRHLPLVLMDPDSHWLVSGMPDARRRFLDWGVFHVEPAFLDTWRRYSRALKQRNAALREQQIRILDSLDELLGRLGEQLTGFREAYFEQFDGVFARQAAASTSELHGVSLEYQRGWKGGSLREALDRARKRDLENGTTSQGPHRADVVLRKEQRAIRTLLSRGEEKNFAANLLLTQARLLAAQGESPLILIDDLASEFDQPHVESVLENALSCGGQVWVTGTAPLEHRQEHKAFHVEHGAVLEVV